MEYVLLAKIGMIIGGVVKSGYVLAGSYFLRTGVQYVKDYKESVENEKSDAK